MSNFIYNFETKTSKKALKSVWENSKAQKEVLNALGKIDKGETLPRNKKNLKGFTSLQEIKLNKTRIILRSGQNSNPDQIIAICMRRDLDNVLSVFKNKHQ